MFLVPSSLLLGMPRVSLLVWRMEEGGKKYPYEGQNHHKAGEIVYDSHQLFIL